MAATGFNQRWKGKIKAAVLMVGPTFFNGPQSVQSYSTASGVSGQTIGQQASIANISASSGGAVFTLSDPLPGIDLDLVLAPTSAIFIKASAGTAFDASTNTVIKSTYAMMLTLTGISTLAWRIQGVFPPSTAGVAPNSGITLSTTT